MRPTRLLTSRPSLRLGLSMSTLLIQGLLLKSLPLANPPGRLGRYRRRCVKAWDLRRFTRSTSQSPVFPSSVRRTSRTTRCGKRHGSCVTWWAIVTTSCKPWRPTKCGWLSWPGTNTRPTCPEHSQMQPKVFWDRRARGLGATLHNPVVSCAEENLLCYPNDPYSTENILIHEFAHAIHGTAGQSLGADFDQRLRAAYKNAKETGLFKDTYAGSNASEYWAEGRAGLV